MYTADELEIRCALAGSPRAEQLIACLEGEIAKRDARIVELKDKAFKRDGRARERDTEILCLRAELAAIKAQGVVMPDNLLSHRVTWRQALVRLIELEDVADPETGRDDKAYWQHELRAFDDMYADLDRLNAAPAAPAADASALADAFLSWKLPNSVRPDGCAMDPTYPHRYGTNLMTWAQAKGMFEYVLSAQSANGVV